MAHFMNSAASRYPPGMQAHSSTLTHYPYASDSQLHYGQPSPHRPTHRDAVTTTTTTNPTALYKDHIAAHPNSQYHRQHGPPHQSVYNSGAGSTRRGQGHQGSHHAPVLAQQPHTQRNSTVARPHVTHHMTHHQQQSQQQQQPQHRQSNGAGQASVRRPPPQAAPAHITPGPCTLADLHGVILAASKGGMIQFPTRHIDEVYPGIFIGNEVAACNLSVLKRLNITHVLNTAVGGGRMHVHTSADSYRGSGIRYKGMAMDDIVTFNIGKFFETAADYIHRVVTSGGRILVHCKAGASRSATIVLAFLMLKRGLPAPEALRTVRARREIYPNDGFLLHLVRLHEKLFVPRKHLTFSLSKRH